MIIVYDRDEDSKKKIITYVTEQSVFDVVLVNIEDAAYELLTEESNLFEEMNNLKGPIILYGKCSDKLVQALQSHRVFSRKDICHMESIFFGGFKNLYFYLYFMSERAKTRRINL